MFYGVVQYSILKHKLLCIEKIIVYESALKYKTYIYTQPILEIKIPLDTVPTNAHLPSCPSVHFLLLNHLHHRVLRSSFVVTKTLPP